jgi:hypothetical protein
VRSKITVIRKVPTRIVRYGVLKWRRRANSRHSPMFQATKSRMPASAASGTYSASGAAARTTAISVSAWTMPATGERAPARTLVTVRAIVPVAGSPPKAGTTMLAMPCAISSWFGSWRGSVVRLSATRAHRSDSTAPSSAMVSVGMKSCCALLQLKGGSASTGRPCGMPPKREPIVSTGRCSSAATTVSTTSATTGPGRRVARGQQNNAATHAAPSASAYGFRVCRCVA